MPFSHHLRDQGHDVLCAPDGLDAREMLERHPDLMLLDLVMPGVDGVHLLAEMRKGYVSSCPVIVVSEDTTPSTREMLADFGVEMFLGKPGLTPDTLIDRVQRTLKKKRGAG
jgi:DNA-binding response OmpR family regulator